jgi:hypothetical protein
MNPKAMSDLYRHIDLVNMLVFTLNFKTCNEHFVLVDCWVALNSFLWIQTHFLCFTSTYWQSFCVLFKCYKFTYFCLCPFVGYTRS